LTQQVHWLDFNKGILLLEMHGTNIKIYVFYLRFIFALPIRFLEKAYEIGKLSTFRESDGGKCLGEKIGRAKNT
jgi:hypothetical protein